MTTHRESIGPVVDSAGLQQSARNATYAVGGVLLALIALSAVWMVERERASVRANAELHLRNFTAVLAEHTRLELNEAPAEALGTLQRIAGGAYLRSGAIDPFFPDHFANLYGRVELGYKSRIFLFRDDATLLTAFPRDEDVEGRSYAQHPLFKEALRLSDVGTFASMGLISAEERLIGYRRVRDYPAVVAISTSMHEVLAPWRRSAAAIASGACVLAALTALGAWLLARQFRTTGALMREIAENELRLDSIIDSAMDAIITVDESQRVVLFNSAAERIFACRSADAIGSGLDRFIPERFRAAHREHMRRFGEAGVTTRRMGGELVLAGLRGDGEEFPIDASISHVTVGGQKFYTVILRDITERQRATNALSKSHEELREMYEAMHQVREAERTRIARELHDELAQLLTALKMDVSWLRARLPATETPLINKADRMKGVVDSTIGAMRRIAADLRPVMLDDLGLVPAIENILNGLAERTGIDVSLSATEALDRLREPLVTAVYRMVQEALTNVIRHANAAHVRVALDIVDDTLRVSVRDDGAGMKPDPDRKTFGVLGIRERARTLGGEARIFSPPEGGTVVEIVVPLARYRDAEVPA